MFSLKDKNKQTKTHLPDPEWYQLSVGYLPSHSTSTQAFVPTV